MRPSETSQGQAWLANFQEDERHPATLLIDSLRVVSSSGFRIALSELLQSAIIESEGPVGVYPIRELHSDGATSFPPLDEPYEAIPGSEGLAGNIIRDAIGRRPDLARASTYKTVAEMREQRVRTLLLVDDYSGSGNQAAKYVDAWLRHPTIKSWHSYGLVRVHVLLLAASAKSLQQLRDHRFIAGVRYLERGLSFDTVPWTAEERTAIEELCRRYGFSRRFALGYQGARGLLALHHGVPNNLPAILWQASCPKLPEWTPLFGDRVMPAEFQAAVDDYQQETDPKRIAAVLRQERLGEALDAQANVTVRNFLLVLGAVEQGYRDPERLSDLLSFSLTTTRRTLEACRALNLVDSSNRLTIPGRAELRRAINRPRLPEPRSSRNGSDAPYYPLSLRGAETK